MTGTAHARQVNPKQLLTYCPLPPLGTIGCSGACGSRGHPQPRDRSLRSSNSALLTAAPLFFVKPNFLISIIIIKILLYQKAAFSLSKFSFCFPHSDLLPQSTHCLHTEPSLHRPGHPSPSLKRHFGNHAFGRQPGRLFPTAGTLFFCLRRPQCLSRSTTNNRLKQIHTAPDSQTSTS